MKRTGILALTAALMMGVTFVSCDKDNDEETTTTTAVAEAVAGSYEGTLIMWVGDSRDTTAATITVTKENAQSVSVALPAYGEGRMAIAAFTIEGVGVAQASNTYTLTKECYSVTPASTEYTGSLNGTVSGGKLQLNYTVKPGAMPMNINFEFVQE